ncbi:unnamed protein product [Meloidogyne enterolobii]|uniref:Uncharacterized protein n=1 Tax=Meloidogyne enterolobii TaxID=390850 RepID=A0ACB0XP15_MELEN
MVGEDFWKNTKKKEGKEELKTKTIKYLEYLPSGDDENKEIDEREKIFSDDQQFPKEDSGSPIWRRNLFLVADEDGADICEWRFNIKEDLQKNKKMEQEGVGGGGQQPWRGIETPTGQPTKSCLKQTPQTSSSPKQQIGNSQGSDSYFFKSIVLFYRPSYFRN